MISPMRQDSESNRYCAMKNNLTQPDDEVTVVEVPFDDVTFARLCEFCESINEPMQMVIFSMVHAVLEDPRVGPNANNDLH